MCVLQHFCRTVSIVDQQVREAMGETLYLLFMVSERGNEVRPVSAVPNDIEAMWEAL